MNEYYVPASPEHIHRERAKARELRSSQWWKQKLAKGICYHCGKSFSKEELTMDHLIPVGRGGKTTKGNVVVSCKACNSRKKHLTPAEIRLEELHQAQKPS